jgi:DNA polymerase I-like protein with 3'-5' exonuclease and polymerase domains
LAKKKKKLQEGACLFCGRVHDPSLTTMPDLPEHGNIILVVGSTSQLDGCTPAMRWLRSALSTMKNQTTMAVRPAFVSACPCVHRNITAKEIGYSREALWGMIHERYQEVPIIALGGDALTFLIGGQHSDTSGAGKVGIIDGHSYAATYGLCSFRDNGEHILATIQSAFATNPTYSQRYVEGDFPCTIKRAVLDVECTNKLLPWYNSRTAIVGLLDLDTELIYQKKAENITNADKKLIEQMDLLVGHYILFDLLHLGSLGIVPHRARLHDTMIYHKNLFPNEPGYGLKWLAKFYLGYPHWDAWFHQQLKNKVPMAEMDLAQLLQYNAIDLLATKELFALQDSIYAPFLLEMDYCRYIYKLIKNGMHINADKIHKLMDDTAVEINALDIQMRKEFALGVNFNFNSSQQLLSLLHSLGIDVPSTGEDLLEEYKDAHPFILNLLRLRNLSKFRGTSCEGLLKWVDENHLVHSTVAVHGAETGRSTSSKPNLQNTDPRVRACYDSRYPDGNLIYSDLSGLEYRVIAHISKEPKLIKTFRAGEDIHCNAYRDIFSKTITKENKSSRDIAKTANYAGVYECGAGKFFTITGIADNRQGRDVYNKARNLYPAVSRWKDTVRESIRVHRPIKNLFGRRREFLNASFADEREAINWIIQSSGHDILKIYLMEAADALYFISPEILLVSEVHDSFTFDSPKAYADEALAAVKMIASKLNDLIFQCFGVDMLIPITADVELLDKWK